MDSLGKITRIIGDVFEGDGLAVAPELEIRKLEKWDSLNHVNLVIAVKDGFEIEITPNEMESIYSVQDVLNLG